MMLSKRHKLRSVVAQGAEKLTALPCKAQEVEQTVQTHVIALRINGGREVEAANGPDVGVIWSVEIPPFAPFAPHIPKLQHLRGKPDQWRENNS